MFEFDEDLKAGKTRDFHSEEELEAQTAAASSGTGATARAGAGAAAAASADLADLAEEVEDPVQDIPDDQLSKLIIITESPLPPSSRRKPVLSSLAPTIDDEPIPRMAPLMSPPDGRKSSVGSGNGSGGGSGSGGSSGIGRKAMTQELASIINDELFFYEQDLRDSKDRSHKPITKVFVEPASRPTAVPSGTSPSAAVPVAIPSATPPSHGQAVPSTPPSNTSTTPRSSAMSASAGSHSYSHAATAAADGANIVTRPARPGRGAPVAKHISKQSRPQEPEPAPRSPIRLYPAAKPKRPRSRSAAKRPQEATVGWIINPNAATSPTPSPSSSPMPTPPTGSSVGSAGGSFQHTSRALLEESGFVQHKYDKFRNRCLKGM